MSGNDVKTSRSSQEKSQGKVHRVRITLSSRDVKNLEKVCADLVGGSQNKRPNVNGDEITPVKRLPVSTDDSPPRVERAPVTQEGRQSKKGCTNFRWSPAMSRFLLPFLVEQVRQGQKVNKSFKRQALVAAARAVSEKFRLICSDSNVENHLRTIKTRYTQVKHLRSLSTASWDEDEKKILMDAASYGRHIMANPKDEPFLNKRIDMYDEMAIICGDEPVSPTVAPIPIAKEIADGIPVISGDDMNVMVDENVVIEEEGEEMPSGSQEVSTSSNSTGRTSVSDLNTRYIADKIDHLAFQIGQLAEAIRSNQKGISPELFQEVMKTEGYDEASLGKAFDYLNEHENLAKGFLAKNFNLRQAWLAEFFSAGDVEMDQVL